MRLSPFALSGLTALAACGEADAPPPSPPAEPTARVELPLPGETESDPLEAARVSVSDTLGKFEGELFGLALWEHPELSFQSAVITANGEAGLVVVPVDRGIELISVPGTFDGAVGVGYLDGGRSVVAAVSGGEAVLFAVGADRVFTEGGRLPLSEPQSDVCLVGSTLIDVAEVPVDYIQQPTVTLGQGESALTVSATPIQGLACAADATRFYVLREDGVHVLSADLAPQDGTLPAPEEAAGLTAVAGERTNLVFFARPGLSLGGEAVTVVEDGEALAVARAAAGSGNFGSVYRDGVLAVLDADGTLRLVPWAGLARAVGATPESASIRPPRAVSTPPELRIELPEIELPGQD